MKSIKATATEIMQDEGFFIVDTNYGTLNICLEERQDGEGFKKAILDDGGFDTGMCEVANEKAMEAFGSDVVLQFLLKEARKAGIRTL